MPLFFLRTERLARHFALRRDVATEALLPPTPVVVVHLRELLVAPALEVLVVLAQEVEHLLAPGVRVPGIVARSTLGIVAQLLVFPEVVREARREDVPAGGHA